MIEVALILVSKEKVNTATCVMLMASVRASNKKILIVGYPTKMALIQIVAHTVTVIVAMVYQRTVINCHGE